MKTSTILFLILFVSNTILSQSNYTFSYTKDFKKFLDLSREEGNNFNYSTLLNRYLQNDSTLTHGEIIAMLIGYTESENYKPYKQMTVERNIYHLNAEGEYKAAIQLSDSLLEKYPFSLLGNREKSYANYKLNNARDQKIYFDRFMQIADAILWTGDGRSYKSSFFVLGPADGQTIIKYVLYNEIVGMGSGASTEDYFHDILDMKDEEGDTITLYFNIDHAMKKSTFYQQLLEVKEKQKEKE